jgi:uncharacterized protein
MEKERKQWALVTGASSGLGIALATELAERGINVVLTARRELPMVNLAKKLETQHGIDTAVEAIDLSVLGSAQALYDRLNARGLQIDILLNNAGFGLVGEFITHDLARLREMLQLDVLAITELTHIFAQQMAALGRGHVLLVASMASLQPDPLMAVYGAAKAYVLSFGEALNVELFPRVNVTVLVPGLMDTEFNQVSGYETKESMRWTMLSPSAVAQIGLDALFAKKPSVTAGKANRVMAFFSRLSSRHLQAKTIYKMSRA